jgi:hypothetical protein
MLDQRMQATRPMGIEQYRHITHLIAAAIDTDKTEFPSFHSFA